MPNRGEKQQQTIDRKRAIIERRERVAAVVNRGEKGATQSDMKEIRAEAREKASEKIGAEAPAAEAKRASKRRGR